METPLLKVSRPVSACARCRNAKIRCDGKLPACSACERAGKTSECSSANDHFAKGKERSYVASLESRIERLEKQLAGFRGPDVIHNSNARQISAVRPARPRGGDGADVDDLVSDFGLLSINATSSSYNGLGREMSFARLVLAMACVAPLPSTTNLVLPERNSVIVLVQECIHNVFAIYPILTETAIFSSIEACYQYGGQLATATDRWNIYMTIAIAFLCRSNARGDRNYQTATLYAGKALEEQELALQPGDVFSTQSVLLLAVYSVLDPAHFSCWYLVSIACRLLVDMGVHQEPALATAGRLLKPADLDLRRRLFHCAYSLDRFMSISFGRAMSFSEDSVSLDKSSLGPGSTLLAVNDVPDQQPGIWGDASTALLHFRRAQSVRYQELFFSGLGNALEPWQARSRELQELDEEFHKLSRTANSNCVALLQADMFYFKIILIKPRRDSPVLCQYGLALLFEYALGYTQCVSLFCREQKQSIACNQIEALRATEVASVFLEVLNNPSCPNLNNSQPLPPSNLGTIPSPTLLKMSAREAIKRGVEALTQLDQVVEVLGRKFGYSKGHDRFKTEITRTLLSLHSRRT